MFYTHVIIVSVSIQLVKVIMSKKGESFCLILQNSPFSYKLIVSFLN